MGYIVSGLTNYVKENKDLLTKEAVFGSRKGDTIEMVGKELGVKGKARMHYLDVNAPLQDGKGCGFSASGNDELSEREIEVAIFKVNKSWCPDDLIGKVYENEVNLAAGKETLPFEAKLMDEVNLSINKQLEGLVWTGATSGNGGTSLIDGYLTRALNQDSANTINVSIATGTTVYESIKKVIFAIPEDIMDNAKVFVSPAIYRKLVDEVLEKNLYHWAPDATQEDRDIVFPGTSIPVHKTIGLSGDKTHIYATVPENMRFGTDMLNDEEEFKLWFSEDDDVFKLKVKFAAGTGVLYPDFVVLGTAAADLV